MPLDDVPPGLTDELIAKVCAELDRRRFPYLRGNVAEFVAVWRSEFPTPELLADRCAALEGASVAAAKDCPRCGLVNSPSAMRCDCGWDFLSRRQEQSYLEPKHRGTAVAGMGVGLVILIVLLVRLVIALAASMANGQ